MTLLLWGRYLARGFDGGAARPPGRRARRREGVLPDDVQALFDRAKALERGRRGRCLDQLVRPDAPAALAEYARAFAALDAWRPPSSDAARAVAHIRAKYAAAAAALAAPRARAPRALLSLIHI